MRARRHHTGRSEGPGAYNWPAPATRRGTGTRPARRAGLRGGTACGLARSWLLNGCRSAPIALARVARAAPGSEAPRRRVVGRGRANAQSCASSREGCGRARSASLGWPRRPPASPMSRVRSCRSERGNLLLRRACCPQLRRRLLSAFLLTANRDALTRAPKTWPLEPAATLDEPARLAFWAASDAAVRPRPVAAEHAYQDA